MYSYGSWLFLMTVFSMKHILGDWVLQSTWMVRGKRRTGLRFILPLSTHALVHAVLTFYLSLYFFIVYGVENIEWYTWSNVITVAAGLSGIDFASHFFIDRTKALFEKLDDRNKLYYVELTFLDQLFHSVVYLGIIWYMLNLLA